MKDSILRLSIGIAVGFLFLWAGDHANAPGLPASGIGQKVETAGNYIQKAGQKAGQDLRKAETQIARVGKTIVGIVREVTAYNVGVGAQTSENPCIGAGGHDLCALIEQDVKVCAANFVPLGTILKIEAFGECIVLDRMHSRFADRVDIAMREDEVDEAKEFGLQKRIVEALF